MKTGIFFILLLLLTGSVAGRAQIFDDFSDGDFTCNPRWEGDSMHFEVNVSRQLHLRWVGAGTSVLATPRPHIGATEWDFWIKLSFNTSANNLLRVYLTADRIDLDLPMQGCFLQVGGAGDSLTIYRQEGTVLTPLFHFPDGYTGQSVNSLRVRITRDEGGSWQGWVDPAGGTDFRLQGTWSDLTPDPDGWFGFWCRYTSSNANRFYMDDLYTGPVIRDTMAPSLAALTIQDSLHLLLTFSEALEEASARDCTHYLLTTTQVRPVEAIVPPGEPDQVRLTFPQAFQRLGTDTLLVSGLSDRAGNVMRDTLAPFSIYQPRAYDLLINEIMYDPEPAVGLPPEEYVEIVNRTPFPLNLAGWWFDAGSVRKAFPPVTIQGHGYLLLASDSTLAVNGPVLPMFTAASTLSNKGDTLVLRNVQLQVVHSVHYSPDWITESWKQEGGWSLELVDPENPCGCDGNWRASKDPSGGTPGRSNSVQGTNPDQVRPDAWRSFLAGSGTWVIRFSESLDTTSLGPPSAWQVEPGGQHPVSLSPVAPGYEMLALLFAASFEPGILYTLSGSTEITDCAGNQADFPVVTRAGIPMSIDPMDIVVNEVLHDPLPGASRFIEIFNRSGKLADLRELALAVSDTGTAGGVPEVTPLTGEPYLLFPLDFVALCASEQGIRQYYRAPYVNRLRRAEPFPSMTNESGTVSLIRLSDEEIIDRITYHRGMHYPLLPSAEGVSLERTSPERPSGDPSNWHSAAEHAGYATPGYENSQRLKADDGEGGITIQPPVFSPDNDGHDDMVSIGISPDEAGYQVTVAIYDASGRRVRELASNVLAGHRDVFVWDGILDDRSVASVGIYIVFVEIVYPEGKVLRFRKPLVVGGRF